jgi:hypothetical protein
MTTDKQISTLELRLRMAVEHVAQCEVDLNAIRAKAGLPAAKSLFNLEKPAGDGWMDDPGRAEWLGHQEAKGARSRALCAAAASAEPPNPLNLLTPEQLRAAVRVVREEQRISPEVMAHLAERGRRERGEPEPTAPIDAKATAAAIVKAAALARGEIVELPPSGTEARAILEAAAKRRSETLDGKPL